MSGSEAATDVLVTISLALYKQLLRNSPTLKKIDKILGLDDAEDQEPAKKRFISRKRHKKK